MFARVAFAEAVKSLKVYFFSSRTLFWALALPLGNGLYLYFLYLPFAATTVDLQFGAAMPTKIDLVGFTIIGQLLYSFFTMMLLAGASFDAERWQGTLEVLLLSPANRLALLLGGALANAVNYMWMLIALVLSWVAFIHVGIFVTDLLALSVSLVLSYAAMIALGMCLETLEIYSRRGSIFTAWLQEPVTFLSGQIFPLQKMPTFLLPLSYLLPLTFGLMAVRLTLLGGASIYAVTMPLAALASMTIIFLVLAGLFVNYAERKAKANATLTQF
jgi:ABC-2 type transport system permease protein